MDAEVKESAVRETMPASEPPVPGETTTERSRRVERNRRVKADYHRRSSERCSFCGETRNNVIHEDDPATAPEGPDYYADMALHLFVEPSHG